MTQTTVKKIKKIGNFYVTKVDAKSSSITGFYFDKKYERFMKIKDRQTYVWFMIFAVLEAVFRPYIYEIVIGLTVLILASNILFYIGFIQRAEKTNIVLPNNEFYDVVDKKHRAWRQTFTMALVFVCLTRLIVFVQPDVFSDTKVTIIYCISLVLSFFTIAFWLYFGSIKNQLKTQMKKPVKKKSARKGSRMKHIQS